MKKDEGAWALLGHAAAVAMGLIGLIRLTTMLAGGLGDLALTTLARIIP
ncbi:MAG: hypothetical protein LBG60_02515 [Bifidobacteriaceae bacterium]|jgi:hypothetical protein|nr:hypothetical protein [Bifidobacteriaceae bacterium]